MVVDLDHVDFARHLCIESGIMMYNASPNYLVNQVTCKKDGYNWFNWDQRQKRQQKAGETHDQMYQQNPCPTRHSTWLRLFARCSHWSMVFFQWQGSCAKPPRSAWLLPRKNATREGCRAHRHSPTAIDSPGRTALSAQETEWDQYVAA